MERVNELLPDGKFRNIDTNFSTNSIYENESIAALPLTANALHKSEMEYNGNFGRNIGRVQNIYIKIRIGIYYTACCLVTQTVMPTIPGFQGLKSFIQYLASNHHKPIFYPYNYYNVSNVIRLTWSVNQLE